MKLALDRYAHLHSPIHAWEPRPKFVALLALILAFAFIEQLVLLPAAIAVTAILYKISRLPLEFLLARLRYPGVFVAAVVALLPFAAGETVLVAWGPLALKQEGTRAALLVAGRFGCILTVSLVLFGTAPFHTSVKALRALGVPATLTDMTLLAYRYLEELGSTLVTVQRAMRLRGFRPRQLSRRNLRLLAAAIGTLVVRSYERSQRLYQAMLLRGYGQAPRTRAPFFLARGELDARSRIAFGVTVTVAAALLGAQMGA
ncbi:MAG: cobalt ECF transporter T component CbiQ [Cyanobacteria bacterium QS_8_64_29]|nr:MAG: cobalt ECF transporter T component CbiQ [Cyanobacteria bacterium QS_8_64_29]